MPIFRNFIDNLQDIGEEIIQGDILGTGLQIIDTVIPGDNPLLDNASDATDAVAIMPAVDGAVDLFTGIFTGGLSGIGSIITPPDGGNTGTGTTPQDSTCQRKPLTCYDRCNMEQDEIYRKCKEINDKYNEELKKLGCKGGCTVQKPQKCNMNKKRKTGCGCS